jgi:hypothetical protein
MSLGGGEHAHLCAAVMISDDPDAQGLVPAAHVLSIRARVAQRFRAREVAAAIRVALREDCDVINCSFTVPEADDDLQDAGQECHARGVPLIVATGNSPGITAGFPHDMVRALVVGGLRHTNRTPYRGKLTRSTDIFTASKDLDVLDERGALVSWDGESSAATALVSGLIALALSPFPAIERRRRASHVEAALRSSGLRFSSSLVPGGFGHAVDGLSFIRTLRSSAI